MQVPLDPEPAVDPAWPEFELLAAAFDALVHVVMPLPMSASRAGVGTFELVVYDPYGTNLGTAVADRTQCRPYTRQPGLDPLAVEVQGNAPAGESGFWYLRDRTRVAKKIGVDTAQPLPDGADRRRPLERVEHLWVQIADHDLRAVDRRIVLGCPAEWHLEALLPLHLPEIDLGHDPVRITDPRSSDLSSVTEAGGRDVETHPEQAEAAEPDPAAVTCSQASLKLGLAHAASVVDHADERVRTRVRSGQRHMNRRGAAGIPIGVGDELIEGVVDELGEALPWLVGDLAQDLKDARIWCQIQLLGSPDFTIGGHVSSTIPGVTGRCVRTGHD